MQAVIQATKALVLLTVAGGRAIIHDLYGHEGPDTDILLCG